jgi:hypothetical protein
VCYQQAPLAIWGSLLYRGLTQVLAAYNLHNVAALNSLIVCTFYAPPTKKVINGIGV